MKKYVAVTVIVVGLVALGHKMGVSVSFGVPAEAAIKKLSDSLVQATPAEKKNLNQLLTGIALAPAVDPATGREVFKVGSVAKGSVYERTGIKAGDLVEMGFDGVSSDGKINLSKKRTAKADSKDVSSDDLKSDSETEAGIGL